MIIATKGEIARFSNSKCKLLLYTTILGFLTVMLLSLVRDRRQTHCIMGTLSEGPIIMASINKNLYADRLQS